MDFDIIEGGSTALLIIALIEIAKLFGLDKKLSPVVAVVLGVGASLALAFYGGTEIFQAVVRGLFVGLSAVGLYSGVKNTVEKGK